MLKFLWEKEFQEVLGSRKLLEALGVVRSDGTINYPVVMEILRLASSDEYLKQRIIKFVVDNFREEVKKAIGLFPYTVTLHWEKDFENYLRYEKKGKKITDEGTLKDYKTLFIKYLEGKELTPQLVEYVVKHPK